MAMTVKEIRAWLDTFPDDALIGISEDDEMCLRPADAGYTTAYLEIGMAISSEYLGWWSLPFVIPTPEIMKAQLEADIEDYFRSHPEKPLPPTKDNDPN